MKTLKNLILTLLTLFTVNSFGTIHLINFNEGSNIELSPLGGDTLDFYSSGSLKHYRVKIDGTDIMLLSGDYVTFSGGGVHIGRFILPTNPVDYPSTFSMSGGANVNADDSFSEGTLNITGTVGINKVENKINLSVYPNPFVDFVNITVDKETNLMITTISGQVIYNDIIQEGNTQIDMTPFPTGIYLVVVGDNRLKVIKN